MKIKDEVFANGSFNIKDGSKTRFWDDAWEGQVPFKAKYPSLFTVVRDPHATVAKVLATRPLNYILGELWWIISWLNGKIL